MTDHPLVAFYAAGLDAEEKTARSAAAYGGAERWRIDIEGCIRPNPATDNGYIACGAFVGSLDDKHAAHIVGHDPQAVLASVLADRHIIARWTALQSPVTLRDRVTFPSLAVVVLECIADRAARFKSHPGYDPAWSLED